MLRAFSRIAVSNEIIVARDGVEAMDYLYGGGRYQDRDINMTPTVVLSSSSTGERDIAGSYSPDANSYIRKSVDYDKFMKAAETLGCYRFSLNEAPPCGKRPAVPADTR